MARSLTSGPEGPKKNAWAAATDSADVAEANLQEPKAAFEQIRMYSKNDVAVSLRLLRALGDIASSTPDTEFHRILVEQGLRTVAGCAEKLGKEELRDLRTRQAALESFTTISEL